MRIICILAGGNGNRFGSPVPKQYHLINGRPVIEYVIDAAIKSVADEILIVSDAERIDELEDKYGVTAIRGGVNRNGSIKNALDYIDAHYSCDEIILVDAVCPLVHWELFNLYFHYLQEYDAVFTASEVTTSLARKDNQPVNRKDYLIIESPDAYRFRILKDHFNAASPYTTPLHMLPSDSRIKFYYDFKDYMKVIYPHDLAVAEALIRERERHIRFEAHTDDKVLGLLSKLRKIDLKGTRLWEKQVDRDVEQLFKKWEIYDFSVNRDAYTGLVLECHSRKYGDVIVKMYPPFLRARYNKESFILSQLSKYPQAPVLDMDNERCTLLLGRVIPGDYIDFEADREEIQHMFRKMYDSRLEAAEVCDIPEEIKGVVEQTFDELKIAGTYDYQKQLVQYLAETASRVYEKNFREEKKYILHGDAYFKNALRSNDGIRVIDPVGYKDAFIFEYMPFLTYELSLHTRTENLRQQYLELIRFFSEFTDTERFNEATFVFLVKQLVPSIYEANDGYRRANRYLQLIRILFLDEQDRIRGELLRTE